MNSLPPAVAAPIVTLFVDVMRLTMVYVVCHGPELVAAANVGKPPASVSTNPLVLTASFESVVAPDAYRMSPVEYEVCPVPPFAAGSAVPDSVTASVPLVVIGEPAMDRNAGTDIATLVTVPDPPPATCELPMQNQSASLERYAKRSTSTAPPPVVLVGSATIAPLYAALNEIVCAADDRISR